MTAKPIPTGINDVSGNVVMVFDRSFGPSYEDAVFVANAWSDIKRLLEELDFLGGSIT